MNFEEWLEEIEESGTRVRGLKHCSLEHRAALRAAFEAGEASKDSESGDVFDFMGRGS